MKKYPIFQREQTNHGNAMFPCAVYQIDSNKDYEERIYCHWHDEIEILLVLDGQAVLKINEISYRLKKGMTAFIPSNCLHMAVGEPGIAFDFAAVVFHPDFLKSITNDKVQQYIDSILEWKLSMPFVWTTQESEDNLNESIPIPGLRTILLEISKLYQNKPAAYELLIKTRLYEVCYLLYTNAYQYQEKETKQTDYRIEQAKDMMLYLHEQYDSQVTLSEMATQFHISKGHLCRFFKEMTNMSPIDYLNFYRINQSAQLLLTTTEEVGEIALCTGFNNISYFNRTFRKHMHMTPSEYRSSN